VCRHYALPDRVCHLTSNSTITLYTAQSTSLLCLYGFNAIRHQLPANILYLHPLAALEQRPQKCSGGSAFTHSFAMWSRVYRRGKARCKSCVHLPAHSVVGTPTTKMATTYPSSLVSPTGIARQPRSTGGQTNRNYVTSKSPRISWPTRPGGWLAGWRVVIDGAAANFRNWRRKSKQRKSLLAVSTIMF
jgi:hypothetical protein